MPDDSARFDQATREILEKADEFKLGKPHTYTPKALPTVAPREDGYWQRFDEGWVYWWPKYGAHVVRGPIFEKWADLKLEQGLLGLPITDETPTEDGVGCYNEFEFGSIYWSPLSGAYEVHGAIRDLWIELGKEQSRLGYPTSDETRAADGVGRYNNFQYGAIVWDPATGAREVFSDIDLPPTTQPMEQPAPPVSQPSPSVIRIDFEGIYRASTPITLYEPGPPVRIDFVGVYTMPFTPTTTYTSGPPVRIDFEGNLPTR